MYQPTVFFLHPAFVVAAPQCISACGHANSSSYSAFIFLFYCMYYYNMWIFYKLLVHLYIQSFFFFFSPSSNSVLGIFCTCIETQKNAGVEKLELRMEESLLLNFYLKLYYFTCPSWFLHILISFSYHWTYKILPVS